MGLLSLLFIALVSETSRAQSYRIVHSFVAPPKTPWAALIQGAGGDLYGTTYQGGVNDLGTVFKMTTAGALTVLHSFADIDGSHPEGSLLLASDGNYYGTTSSGGPAGYGTVFRLTPAGALTTLYSFSGPDGAAPVAGLIQAKDKLLYGTTGAGGPSDTGTIFKMTFGGALTTLHYFSGNGGAYPEASLLEGADGNFYGTTSQTTSDSGYGTVFKVTPGGELTTLVDFNWSIGAFPVSSLLQTESGDLYGMAREGGQYGYGTVYRIPVSGMPTRLHSFSCMDGAYPQAGLVDGGDGDLYGTTFGDGSCNYGTVIRISPSGIFTKLHDFQWTDGASPASALLLGGDGFFYGATSEDGGGFYPGTVFRLSSSGTFTTVSHFSQDDGLQPAAELMQRPDGTLFGTTAGGGSYGAGTVFSIQSSGGLTTLHSFSGADGAYPYNGLLEATDGNLYGTTYYGGQSGAGAVFRLAPDRTFTNIHSFSWSEGVYPLSTLVQGDGGDLFGTTSSGSNGTAYGTVFRMTTGGMLTTLHVFDVYSRTDGANPYAGLFRASDGLLYGTTFGGGSAGSGTLYRISPSGSFGLVASFPTFPSGARNPSSVLVDGGDGYLYGTTRYYYNPIFGSVFRTTLAGDLSILHSFSGADGRDPRAGVIHALDGSFYGTTRLGGSSNLGTIFSVTPSGTLTTLHSFSGVDGAKPVSALVQAADGKLYGTTQYGGAGGVGVVFQLDPNGPPTPTAAVSGGGTYCSTGSAVIRADLTGTPPWSLTWSDGFVQSNIPSTPATRAVSPTATTLYRLTAVSDVNGQGFVSGSARVTVSSPLSGLTISTVANPTLCPGHYLWAWATTIGGGNVVIVWRYRTVSGGPSSPISSTGGPEPKFIAEDFPGPGSYYLVATATPSCGSPMTSIELPITVAAKPGTPVISMPSVVGAGSPNRVASVAQHPGSTYSWTISNGTVTVGQGTNQITFTAGTASTPVQLSATEISSSGCPSDFAYAQASVLSRGSAVQFFTVPPCRIVDTRAASGFPSGYGPPTMTAGSQRDFVLDGQCGIPSTATAVSANLTIWAPVTRGDMRAFQTGGTLPNTSILSWEGGILAQANAGILQLSTGGAVTLKLDGPGAVDVILDVNGYFQ